MTSLRHAVDKDKRPNQINVIRENVWERAMMGFGRKRFDVKAPLNVVFLNNLLGDDHAAEGAVDLGGPQRELFTLCYKAMINGQCFIGGDKKILTRDISGKLIWCFC